MPRRRGKVVAARAGCKSKRLASKGSVGVATKSFQCEVCEISVNSETQLSQVGGAAKVTNATRATRAQRKGMFCEMFYSLCCAEVVGSDAWCWSLIILTLASVNLSRSDLRRGEQKKKACSNLRSKVQISIVAFL